MDLTIHNAIVAQFRADHRRWKVRQRPYMAQGSAGGGLLARSAARLGS